MDRPIVAKHDMKDWLFYTFWKCARRREKKSRGFKAGARERLNAEPVDARERRSRFDTSSTS
jgi:hypothetical protein